MKERLFIEKTHKNIKSLMDNYIYACTKDVELIKPGNVRKGSPHKDTTAEDYITSAISSSSTLCSNELTLGDRTYLSVSHTRAKINVNTNLGIILLCCPIIHSIINYNQLELCDAIKSSLEDSSSNDTRKICKSISIVMPGGLGTSEKMDVNSNPDVSILEIMKYSSNYDRIAYQYANNFDDIFNFIVPLIIRRVESLKSLDFALSMVFLEVLASIPDSHISRKFGHKIAKKTSNQANDLLKIIDRDLSQDKAYIKILQLDDEYKKKGLNPGTSADLLVASLFVYKHFYDYTASST